MVALNRDNTEQLNDLDEGKSKNGKKNFDNKLIKGCKSYVRNHEVNKCRAKNKINNGRGKLDTTSIFFIVRSSRLVLLTE